jgi:formamidopyrimidine-DNA glycosylase
MPELPEVETMRRGIAEIVGSRIRDVRRPRCRLRPIGMTPRFAVFRRRAAGRQIVATERVGKRVVLVLESGDRIVLEPRMTGRILLAEPPDKAHLRLIFDLADGPFPQLLFWSLRGLGSVRLLSPEQFASELGPKYVGPDALEVTPQDLRERLGKSRRAIKVALLDQRAVAGIGNLYASEILHRARLHPECPCHRISAAKWNALQRTTRQVLEAAIECQGSTLSDDGYRNPHNESGQFQNEHRVYQRAGQRCVQCGRARIVRIVQAQRSTFFCPRCQRRRWKDQHGRPFAPDPAD